MCLERAATPKRNDRGERTRTALLDAAERVFSVHGYYGASIRDIAAEAGVNLGSVHYHFQSKEELFHAAVWRKEPRIRALLEESYEQAEAEAAPCPLSLEEVIGAYLRPLLTVCVSEDHDLKNFVRMTSHMATSYWIPEVRNTMRGYTDINQPLIRRLKAIFPNLVEGDFYVGLYALCATVIFVEQDTGFVDDITHGRIQASRMDQLIKPLTRLFAGGLASLCAATE